ncbi:PREDICTED: uncharacterized protein LOC107070093 [Polistes dominula]|uniref:MICOS complex subunit MIC13 n=1 Tax=Polistes dominula TaxID=743375 RepID=A0ABM1ITB4_POLDO|nr:PREDICTED: uncharacterized protein LOC107070093 [Polistes dominula]
MGLMRFTIKASLVGGIIYYSVQEGIWSKHDDSLKVYDKIHQNLDPYLKDNIPKEITKEISSIPNVTDFRHWLATKWNAGVITSIKFVADSPSHIANAYETVSKFTKEKTEQLTKTE